MDAAGTELTLDPDSGAVNEFQPNGPNSRPGVDLLLAHVHEFRVEVWDQRLNAFAPIGHSLASFGVPGDFNAGRRMNLTYGPLPLSAATTNVFDTWHPTFDRNFNVPSGVPLGDVADRPPFRPMNFDPLNLSAPAPNNAAGNPYWQPNTSYNGPTPTYAGDVVFEPPFDTDGNGVIDYYDYLQVNNKYRANSFIFSYRCLGRADGVAGAGTSANVGAGDPIPSFPTTVGRVFTESRAADTTDLKWRTEYNLRPLRAIRVTVRFEHPQSKQMRQVTVVHSLRDTTVVP